MHNRDLHLRFYKCNKENIDKEKEFNKKELTYFTPCKMRVNSLKHYEEDEKFENKMDIPYKTKRYVKKLELREECSTLSVERFLKDPEYEKMNVWDLKYISTSDEEDNDSEETSSEDDDEEEEAAEDG
jgi:hypothetical protein